MICYLATHQDDIHELFSHSDDAKRWVEYQAHSYRQEIGEWITHDGDEESLRLADGKTYSGGKVRFMTLDKRAEHRRYEAEQRAEKREIREATEAKELSELRTEVQQLRERVAELLQRRDDLLVETATAPAVEDDAS